MERLAKIMAGILAVVMVCGMAQRASAQATGQAPARSKRISIVASTVLDGKGKVLRGARIVVEGEKIAAVAPTPKDLRKESVDADIPRTTIRHARPNPASPSLR